MSGVWCLANDCFTGQEGITAVLSRLHFELDDAMHDAKAGVCHGLCVSGGISPICRDYEEASVCQG